MIKKILVFVAICTTLFSLKAQEVISTEYLDHYTAEEMINTFGIPAPFVQNGVLLYKMTYTTPDVNGESSIASGLVCVPDAAMAYPLLCYQHGTVSNRENVPSNIEGDELGIVFCAFGYVTSSADLLGLGDSPGLHPYVHAATEASAAIDMLRAVRTFVADADNNFSAEVHDQVFVTGYSQGGHSAMAAHRAMELEFADEFQVTAAGPMSGPYSISGAMRDLIFAEEEYFFVAYLPHTFLSYNYAYDLGFTPEDFFKPTYATMINQFANEEIDLGDLNQMLIQGLTQELGGSYPYGLFLDGVAEEIQDDENHPINVALRDNDVYDWTPTAPTRLYYCTADDQVPYHNSIIADTTMNNNGALDIFSTDVNSDADHGACVVPAVTSCALFFANYQEVMPLILTTEEVHDAATFSLSPNPVKSFLTIEFIEENQQEAIVQLVDNAGKVVLQETIKRENNQLNISALPNGIYMVNAITDGKSWTERLLLIR